MNQDGQGPNDQGAGRGGRAWPEWLAGGIGLLLAIGLIGVIAYQAMTGGDEAPPNLTFKLSPVEASGRYHLVEIEAQNLSEATAQQVAVEVTLDRAGATVEKGQVTFDYIPGGSKVKGGVFFSEDPRSGQLDVRPLGYSEP